MQAASLQAGWLTAGSKFSLTELSCPEPGPQTPIPGPEAISFSTPMILHVSKMSESNPLDLMLSQCQSSKTSDEKLVKTSGEETEIPGQKREACHCVKKKEDQH